MNGTLRETGYQASCFHGSLGNVFPGCCRINVRDGTTTCRLATNFQSSAYVASLTVDPFATGSIGAWSLSCFAGVSGENFPTCCRTDKVSGSVTCRSANNWQLSSRGTVGQSY